MSGGGPRAFARRALWLNVGAPTTYTWSILGIVTTFTDGPAFTPGETPLEPPTGGPVADAGVQSGFMMPQVTAAALASECKVLSHPASVDTIPTDGSKEDVVPMAMGAAWKLRRVVRNVQYVLAIELLCGAQALEYRRPLRPGRLTGEAHDRVRAHAASLGRDRTLSPDIERLAAAVARGEFAAVAGDDPVMERQA